MPHTGRQPEDGALIERARHGDHEAYAALVRTHQDVVFRTAYLITRSAADAEDVTQEAFIKAYRALSGFREGAPFRPWILRIAANEARNRRRAIGRRLEVSADAPVERDGGLVTAPEPADPDATPEELALAVERREVLLAALGRLDEDDRLVIAYRYFFDLSEAEMAEALDVPRGTVKSRLSRALARLRERFPVAG
jgi:RNA polymerase sigma factor (sigma-70 family)